jgi:hypothetical protein
MAVASLVSAWSAAGKPSPRNGETWMYVAGSKATRLEVLKWAIYLAALYSTGPHTRESIIMAIQNISTLWQIGPFNNRTAFMIWSQFVADCIGMLQRRVRVMSRSPGSRNKTILMLKELRDRSSCRPMLFQPMSSLGELLVGSETPMASDSVKPKCARRVSALPQRSTAMPAVESATTALLSECKAVTGNKPEVDVVAQQRALVQKKKKEEGGGGAKFTWGALEKASYSSAKKEYFQKVLAVLNNMEVASAASPSDKNAAVSKLWFKSAEFEKALQGMPLQERKRRRFYYE